MINKFYLLLISFISFISLNNAIPFKSKSIYSPSICDEDELLIIDAVGFSLSAQTGHTYDCTYQIQAEELPPKIETTVINSMSIRYHIWFSRSGIGIDNISLKIGSDSETLPSFTTNSNQPYCCANTPSSDIDSWREFVRTSTGDCYTITNCLGNPQAWELSDFASLTTRITTNADDTINIHQDGTELEIDWTIDSEVTDYSPKSAKEEEEVVITGSAFWKDPSNNNILCYFPESEAVAAEFISDTEIRCKVPLKAGTGTLEWSLNGGATKESIGNFKTDKLFGLDKETQQTALIGGVSLFLVVGISFSSLAILAFVGRKILYREAEKLAIEDGVDPSVYRQSVASMSMLTQASVLLSRAPAKDKEDEENENVETSLVVDLDSPNKENDGQPAPRKVTFKDKKSNTAARALLKKSAQQRRERRGSERKKSTGSSKARKGSVSSPSSSNKKGSPTRKNSKSIPRKQ